MELKTLKDLEPEPCCHGINQKELKQAAIEYYTEIVNLSTETMLWIMNFFNLTGEDLSQESSSMAANIGEAQVTKALGSNPSTDIFPYITNDMKELNSQEKIKISGTIDSKPFVRSPDTLSFKAWINENTNSRVYWEEDVKEFIKRVEDLARINRDDILKVPIHTLEKKGIHSKTPEEMRQICAEAFNDFVFEIDKLAGEKL